jgi:putative membrane protein
MPSEAAAALADGRRLHPLSLGFSAVTIARKMVWPALVGGFGLGDGEIARMLPIFIAALAVPALIGATLEYVLYRWRLTGDELLLRSGVLSRRNRVIPLARVQNVEVRQNVMHRVFGVAELRVETAGAGAEAEAVLSVLGLAEAQAARVRLLAHRRASAAIAVSADGEADAIERPAVPPLAQLSTGDVLLAGATANEAGVIAAALAGLLQFADDLPLPFFEQVGDAVMGRAAESWLVFGIGLVILFLLLGWMISIAGAVVRYHGFTLSVEGGEMRKRYGLLTVHEASVPLERVQAIRVEESLPRRLLGLASLSIETAGGTPGQRGGAEAFVPIARRAEVGRLVRGIFGDADADTPLRPVHPRARMRLAIRYSVLLLLVWAPFWGARWLDVQPLAGRLAPWLAVLLPLPWLAAGLAYRGRGWALPPGYVMARSGVMTRVTWIVPDRKLQTLHLRATPFQRRRGLATVVVDTAAGGRQAAIIDLGEPTARRLLEELTDRIRAATQLRAAERIARTAGQAAGQGDANLDVERGSSFVAAAGVAERPLDASPATPDSGNDDPRTKAPEPVGEGHPADSVDAA